MRHQASPAVCLKTVALTILLGSLAGCGNNATFSEGTPKSAGKTADSSRASTPNAAPNQNNVADSAPAKPDGSTSEGNKSSLQASQPDATNGPGSSAGGASSTGNAPSLQTAQSDATNGAATGGNSPSGSSMAGTSTNDSSANPVASRDPSIDVDNGIVQLKAAQLPEPAGGAVNYGEYRWTEGINPLNAAGTPSLTPAVAAAFSASKTWVAAGFGGGQAIGGTGNNEFWTWRVSYRQTNIRITTDVVTERLNRCDVDEVMIGRAPRQGNEAAGLTVQRILCAQLIGQLTTTNLMSMPYVWNFNNSPTPCPVNTAEVGFECQGSCNATDPAVTWCAAIQKK